MGNPHCVLFVEDDSVFRLDDHDFAGLGRQFESHPLFPDRVNTEFILPVSRRHLRMRVWERGSGETLGMRHRRVRRAGRGGTDRHVPSATRRSSFAAASWRSNGAQAARPLITCS